MKISPQFLSLLGTQGLFICEITSAQNMCYSADYIAMNT